MGGTFEPIDAVRGITNNSSGKMGLELAKEAYIRGLDLTIVVGNVSVEIPYIFNTINVKTAQEMSEVIFDLISDVDIFISTAAVSDFKVKNVSDVKIDSTKSLDINLEPTVKILSKVKEFNPDIFLVGFKAKYNVSSNELIESALKQIEESHVDLVIANDVGECYFNSDKNKIFIVGNKTVETPILPKKEIAKIIFDEIFKIL